MDGPDAHVMHGVLGRLQVLRRADVKPFAIVADAVEPAAFRRLVIDAVEGERPLWRGVEQPRVQDLHAGDDEGRDLALPAPAGKVRRRREREVAPFVFAGMQILHPRLLDSTPEGPFSLNRIYDQAEERGRLHVVCHDGEWFHVGTPEDLRLAEDAMHHMSEGAIHR